MVVSPGPAVSAFYDELAAVSDTSARLAVLCDLVLPRLVQTYEVHSAAASPVRDGPIMRIMAILRSEHDAAIVRGHDLDEFVMTSVTSKTANSPSVDVVNGLLTEMIDLMSDKTAR